MAKIVFTSNTLEFDTRKIWDSANAHQNYIMFLENEIRLVKSTVKSVMIKKMKFHTWRLCPSPGI
jgi:hypothetical protein